MKGIFSLLVACLVMLIPGVAFADGVVACPQLSPMEQAGATVFGYLDSPGLLTFLGAILVVIAVGGILGKLIDFSWMSENAWGVLGCALSAGMMTYGLWAPELFTAVVPIPVVTFIGSLILIPSLAALLSGSDGPPSAFTSILTVIYVIAALALQSQSIGFLAVLAFMSTLGFTGIGGGLSYAIGFESEDKLPAATIAGVLLAGGYALARFYLPEQSMFSVFEAGAFWIGTFVAAIGMLIISTKWYNEDDDGRRHMPYILRQVLAIAMYGGAMYAGIMINNGPLLYIAGGFAALYIIEKFYEVVPKNFFWYMGLTAIFGISMIWGAFWLKDNMDVFHTYVASIRS